MPETLIAGIPVNFPFEPYDVQRAYMEKVIMCLRDSSNGILESPTGTGKTLSLLCSSLAWLLTKKQEMKANIQKISTINANNDENMGSSTDQLVMVNQSKGKGNWGIPKIIYASRTHSQLTQAMQELKRTSYSFMKAVVLGSRDQLCIHPDVMKEKANMDKIQLCKLRVQTRTCSFYSRVESRKDDPDFRGQSIMDIEDLVKAGKKLKMCPYYASKELVEDADIVFMPYNYLLDPSARKANKIELSNAICILDEAHNIEKICEESASGQIKSSDVAIAIEDTTHVMKAMSSGEMQDTGDEPKDFTLDDLALLKEMLLELEKAIDNIVVENKQEGATFPPSFMFDLLAQANISYGSSRAILALLDKLIQFMTVGSQHNHLRKGGSYQKLSDLLTIVFFNNKEDTIHKVYRSFKVHVQIEEPKQQYTKGTHKDGWLTKGNTTTKAAKIINYWCFNPGFGMEQLLNKNVRSIILTSGTLAPLNPLIAELSMPVAQRLENPHIVESSQVFVKIIGSGPDREQLISNYQNRDNPKYISSLGSTILNVARVVPDGLLVFFPSYPLLNQCANSWQASGLWSDISRYKPIFVEPRGKEDFLTTMESFYQSINDSKGACFMAVCRGKVSEGLDFADRNGRAVIITGLPFPPLKDPKVILKKKYLDDNRTKENELLTGQAWYALDATRAVNQAIGRVIRHRSDYGAILLCDIRFQQQSQVQQLSKWIRDILGTAPKNTTFGPVVKELRDFFKNAEKTMPTAKERCVATLKSDICEDSSAEVVRSKYFADPKDILTTKTKVPNIRRDNIKVENSNSISSWTPNDYASAAGRLHSDKLPSAMDFMSRLDSDVCAIDFNSSRNDNDEEKNCPTTPDLVKIHKRERSPQFGRPVSNSETIKKKKYKLVENTFVSRTNLSSSTSSLSLNSFELKKTKLGNQTASEERVEFLKVLRSSLSPADFSAFTAALITYKREDTIDCLLDLLFRLLGKPQLLNMLRGMRRFLKIEHRPQFDERMAGLT